MWLTHSVHSARNNITKTSTKSTKWNNNSTKGDYKCNAALFARFCFFSPHFFLFCLTFASFHVYRAKVSQPKPDYTRSPFCSDSGHTRQMQPIVSMISVILVYAIQNEIQCFCFNTFAPYSVQRCKCIHFLFLFFLANGFSQWTLNIGQL